MELRPFQDECSRALIRDLKDPEVKSCGAILSTGAGKTVIFEYVANEYLKDKPHDSVLVLSHLDILTQQTYSRFKVDYPNLKIGILQGGTFPNYLDDIVISTMQSARVEEKADRYKRLSIKQPSLIIVDECHYIPNESYSTILGYFPNAKVMGFTATPFRDGKLMTSYFDRISYSISLQELIDQGYLIPPRLIEIEDESKEIEHIMAWIVKTYMLGEMGKKSIIFMDSIENAKALRNVFLSANIHSMPVTSETSSEAREQIFRDFQYGNLDILTTVNVLTAGFDCDVVESIFMPFPTKSPSTFMQRIGRGLRLCKRIDKKECRIYIRGDAPSIKRGEYKRLNHLVLNEATKDPNKVTTVFDELEFLQFDEEAKEKYEWTREVCNAVKKMQSLGLDETAKMLSQKAFPKKFLKDIVNFSKHITVSSDTSKDAINSAQKRMLIQMGFDQSEVYKLRKGEASDLITSITNYQNRYKTSPDFKWQITEGKWAGKHPRDLPGPMIGWMKKNPHSPVSKQYFAWWHAEGKHERVNK